MFNERAGAGAGPGTLCNIGEQSIHTPAFPHLANRSSQNGINPLGSLNVSIVFHLATSMPPAPSFQPLLTSPAISVKIPRSSRSVATEPGTSPFCQAWRNLYRNRAHVTFFSIFYRKEA